MHTLLTGSIYKWRSLALLFLLLIVAFIFMVRCGSDSSESNQAALSADEMKEQSIAAFQAFGNDLRGELTSAMAEGGPVAAIEVCKVTSPAMEAEASESSPFELTRVSERFRNPDHKPDPFEASVLAQWQAQLDAGEQIGPIAEGSDDGFRVMAPIMIQGQACLQCHGAVSEMNPELNAKLNELYPDDSATGYELGQLRGAFSATWK